MVIKITSMKKEIKLLIISLLMVSSCNVDKEIYLITDKDDAYITEVQLYANDNRNVVLQCDIEEDSGIINLLVKNGTNINYLKPRCSLSPESTILPKMGIWTDFSEPIEYTVFSGSKKVTKKYIIYITEQK